MEFHRIPAEKLRDQIFKIMIEKGLVKDGLTFDDLKLSIPFDDNDNIVHESDNNVDPDSVVNTEIFSDSIQDDTDNNQVPGNSTDKITSKDEKSKKEKKETAKTESKIEETPEEKDFADVDFENDDE